MVQVTRTVQFRVQDVGFWKNGRILPQHSPLKLLLTADAATMKILNQKNGGTGQTFHQESNPSPGINRTNRQCSSTHEMSTSHSAQWGYQGPTYLWYFFQFFIADSKTDFLEQLEAFVIFLWSILLPDFFIVLKAIEMENEIKQSTPPRFENSVPLVQEERNPQQFHQIHYQSQIGSQCHVGSRTKFNLVKTTT